MQNKRKDINNLITTNQLLTKPHAQKNDTILS